MRTSNSEHRDLPTNFREQMDILATLGGFANHVSMAQTGLPAAPNAHLASMVFAKCCAHARSIGAISLQSSMFDHHAIMALARMILEASTMVAYLLDPVSSEEWELRHTVLRLHDTVARIKLLRGFEAPADDLRTGRAQLKAELEENPVFQNLAEDRRKRLMSGEEMFVTGMRSVATKIMGWNESKFTGIYAYFSAHAHSAPMSFVRMADHKIDYFFPSETQTDILALSTETAIACLRRTMLRMIDQQPSQLGLYHPELLAEARELDLQSPLFNPTEVA
jgi:hypothetical protein